MTSYRPSLEDPPYARLGGDAGVRALVERFYDAMEEHEPALAKLHQVDPEGKVTRAARDKFALFFIGWLGGPQDYVAQHGHPRLRMRHGHVPVNTSMRDAWLRSMNRAMNHPSIAADAREYVETKLAEVADFLRNKAD